MICNKTWIAGIFCLTSLGTVTIIFLIQSDQVFVHLGNSYKHSWNSATQAKQFKVPHIPQEGHSGASCASPTSTAVTDCSEMCFHCSDEYFGLLCSPPSQEKDVNTHHLL